MYTSTTNRWRRAVLAAMLGLLAPAVAQAQALNYTVANAQNVAGTYTDLGAAGTAIATANTDDANAAPLPIGFAFSYNGTVFTDFVFNTNGLIRLGTAPPSVPNLFHSEDTTPGNTAVDPVFSTSPADANLLLAFNMDLTTGSAAGGAQYRYATTGTLGSRVTTIQWKNVSDKPGSGTDVSDTQYASFSFQLKLYEGSNNIDFVYGPTVPGVPANDTFRFAEVGIIGSGGQSVLANKTGSTVPWSGTVFIVGPYGTSDHNIRGTVPADLGRTYRFRATTVMTVDAAVAALYTLGRVSPTFSSPHTVQAAVKNLGNSALTNLAVTLTVSGATSFTNTQTVATLATGATTTVTFATYALPATGTNTVTVTLTPPPGDASAANNTASSQQVVGNLLDYTDPAPMATFASSLGGTMANTVFLVKYTVNAPTSVTAITPTFSAGTAGMSDTYQVQLYSATGAGGAPGALLYTSAARPRPVAAGPETVSIPATAVSGSFYVATKQLTAINLGLAYQAELPLRPGVFYFTNNGSTFTDLATVSLNPPPGRLAIQATLSAPITSCNPVTNLSVGAVTGASASVSFTPGAGNTSYTVSYTPAGGATTTVTPNPTSSPVTLIGLTPGTAYTITVTPICAGGGTAATTSTTFRTLGLATRSALADGAVSVFPNPAQQSFTVAIPAVGAVRVAQLDIINSLGQVVQTQHVSLNGATQAVIDAANLAMGLYTVRVQAGAETAAVRLAIQ